MVAQGVDGGVPALRLLSGLLFGAKGCAAFFHQCECQPQCWHFHDKRSCPHHLPEPAKAGNTLRP